MTAVECPYQSVSSDDLDMHQHLGIEKAAANTDTQASLIDPGSIGDKHGSSMAKRYSKRSGLF
jgi:hypothetical protein